MIASLPLPAILLLFALAAAAVLLLGLRMTAVADRLADRTGLGEAVIGGVVLGAATSLSGVVVSATSALDGRASLAFANGVGGIAAQTAFLAVADLLHRRANLEHAAADFANVFQCALLMLMLAAPLLAYAGPEVALWAIHPASAVLLGAYVFGVVATLKARERPMWRPVRTSETRDHEDDDAEGGGGDADLSRLVISFGLLVAGLALAGWTIAQSGAAISDRLGVSETAVGALLTAVATSLPELVTTIAAVRRGALQLAVGGVVGGNIFDTLFLTLSDAAYREGSLYHAITRADLFWLTIGLAMTATLLLGLLFRQQRGPAGIGVESAALLVIYGGAIAIQSLA